MKVRNAQPADGVSLTQPNEAATYLIEIKQVAIRIRGGNDIGGINGLILVASSSRFFLAACFSRSFLDS